MKTVYVGCGKGGGVWDYFFRCPECKAGYRLETAHGRYGCVGNFVCPQCGTRYHANNDDGSFPKLTVSYIEGDGGFAARVEETFYRLKILVEYAAFAYRYNAPPEHIDELTDKKDGILGMIIDYLDDGHFEENGNFEKLFSTFQRVNDLRETAEKDDFFHKEHELWKLVHSVILCIINLAAEKKSIEIPSELRVRTEKISEYINILQDNFKPKKDFNACRDFWNEEVCYEDEAPNLNQHSGQKTDSAEKPDNAIHVYCHTEPEKPNTEKFPVIFERFAKWLDGVLEEKLPENAETVRLILSEENGGDWSARFAACSGLSEIFSSRDKFCWHEETDRAGALNKAVLLLSVYYEKGKHQELLRALASSDAGFADGGYETVYKNKEYKKPPKEEKSEIPPRRLENAIPQWSKDPKQFREQWVEAVPPTSERAGKFGTIKLKTREEYAFYKGVKYIASYSPLDEKVKLRSDDESSRKLGFKRDEYYDFYTLDVDENEVDGCFEARLYAVYKGIRFDVMSDINGVFELMSFWWHEEEAKALGFKMIDRNEWIKEVSRELMDDVFYKFEDKIETRKTQCRIESERKQLKQILAAKGLREYHDFDVVYRAFPTAHGFCSELGKWFVYENGHGENRYTFTGPFAMNGAIGAFAELSGRTEQFPEYKLTDEERKIYDNNVFHDFDSYHKFIEELDFGSSRLEYL